MQDVIQASFNSGEWSPKLYSRVDLQKYRSGAALLLNFFVDYRGGASTRPGTKWIMQCLDSFNPVRLIPFQASFAIGYLLELGAGYIRFYYQGAPVLEAPTSISAAAVGIPTVFTDTAHGYSNGQWIFVQNNYYIVQAVTTNTFTLTDLFGNAILTNPFTLPAAAQRVYTISTPYLGSELALIKFSQNVNTLILCHPNHPPYQLVLNSPTNWSLTKISFGASVSAPSAPTVATTLSAGPVNYSYVVTSIDANGQESEASVPANSGALQNMATTPGSNSVSWSAVTGAVSYNVYKATVSYFGTVPAGVQYGFIGNVTGTTIIDTNIAADFSESPPIAQNPFFGSSVATITLTASGTGFNAVPTLALTAPPPGGVQATAFAILTTAPTSGIVLNNPGFGYKVGDTLTGPGGISLTVLTLNGTSGVATFSISNRGALSSGSAPTTGVTFVDSGTSGVGVTFNLVWVVGSVGLGSGGTGYSVAPTVTITGGSPSVNASATTTLGASSNGNPTVPGFFQQRLVLAGEVQNPQGFNMSKSGLYYNFDVSLISAPDDAISGTLVSGQLNTIKAMVPQPSGLLMFTDRNNWIINGGSQGSPVTPSALAANAQSFNGISDVPPITANFDILYVQAKGSIVRDSTYNIYANVYTGTDISAIASHLFYGYTVNEWAWAEEPFKVVWAIRSDGTMLTLTFLKEQEFIGWAHSTTQGLFKSVATVIENTPTAGEVDAIYTVVQRVVQGQTLKYIERVAERTFPNGVVDAWIVDCGIQYQGPPATSFTGATFLGGQTVTGLADGVVIPPFTMPVNGAFSLSNPASKVTVGLGFTAQLQTLPLEMGDPTVQGKVKKINEVDVLVADTLGLEIGSSFNHLVEMKDLVRGNVSSMLTGQDTQVVTDLVNGQARTFLDPTYTVPGQYCIQQSQPLPATILGVVPNITVGDGGQRSR